jgi:hypothetical protein
LLVIGGRLDPATPYPSAVALADTLPSSRLLTWDGGGHVASGRSACIDEAVDAYLIDGVLPDVGTVCRPTRHADADTGKRYAPSFVPAGWRVYSALDVETNDAPSKVELLLLTGEPGETISVYAGEDDGEVELASGTSDDGGEDVDIGNGPARRVDLGNDRLTGVVVHRADGVTFAVVGTDVDEGDVDAVVAGVQAQRDGSGGVSLSLARPPLGFAQAYEGLMPGYGDDAYGYVSWEDPNVSSSDLTMELDVGVDYGPEALAGETAQQVIDGEDDDAAALITFSPEPGVIVTVSATDMSADDVLRLVGSIAPVSKEQWASLVAEGDEA